MIPDIFRKVVDEMLVELHLLNHKKEFKPDHLFSIGLIKAFDDLTNGYKPREHLEILFNAICNCNGVDPTKIQSYSKKGLEQLKGIKLEEIKNIKSISELNIDLLNETGIIYSRISLIGLYNVVCKIEQEDPSKEVDSNDTITITLAKLLGFQEDRVEKDLSVYISSVDKIKQSLELIKLINQKSKSDK